MLVSEFIDALCDLDPDAQLVNPNNWAVSMKVREGDMTGFAVVEMEDFIPMNRTLN